MEKAKQLRMIVREGEDGLRYFAGKDKGWASVPSEALKITEDFGEYQFKTFCRDNPGTFHLEKVEDELK